MCLSNYKLGIFKVWYQILRPNTWLTFQKLIFLSEFQIGGLHFSKNINNCSKSLISKPNLYTRVLSVVVTKFDNVFSVSCYIKSLKKYSFFTRLTSNELKLIPISITIIKFCKKIHDWSMKNAEIIFWKYHIQVP